eukprot:2542477-Amphidinium_carterae.2
MGTEVRFDTRLSRRGASKERACREAHPWPGQAEGNAERPSDSSAASYPQKVPDEVRWMEGMAGRRTPDHADRGGWVSRA